MNEGASVAGRPNAVGQNQLCRDNTFSGVLSIGDSPYWTYAGKWQIDGRALTYYYQQSSRPLSEADKTDIDDIVAVSTNALVLRPRKSGAEHIFLRAE